MITKKESTREKSVWQWNCISRKYKTIIEKYSLLLHKRLWTQIQSQIGSYCSNTEFYKEVFDRPDTKERQKFQLLVPSVQQTATKVQN